MALKGVDIGDSTLFFICVITHMLTSTPLCVCVCVRERERERVRQCVRACVIMRDE